MKKLRLARFLAALFSLLPSANKIVAEKSRQIAPPFFIISAGRSGSTLLNRMLNEHTRLFLPSEQYFLGVSIIKYRLYRFLIWRDLVKIILGELLVSSSHTWILQQPGGLFDDLVSLAKEERSLQRILNTVFKEYAAQSGKKEHMRWGDSTPLNAHYIREVQTAFPDAAFIFLMRDGREVVSSFKKGGSKAFGHLANPVNAAHHWNKSVTALDFLKRQGSQVLQIKYEELVANPADTLTMICRFLGVEFDSGMLQYHQNIPDTPFYHDAHHQKLKMPVSSPVTEWRRALSEEEQKSVLRIIGRNLERFGYL